MVHLAPQGIELALRFLNACSRRTSEVKHQLDHSLDITTDERDGGEPSYATRMHASLHTLGIAVMATLIEL